VLIFYFRSQRGFPSMVLPLFVFVVLISPWNDNHGLRMLEDAGAVSRLAQAAKSRPTLEDHFERWIERQQPLADGTIPAYVVAAQGGGLRAAYWTATVLARLHDQTEGGFTRSAFAISGVSGGSLGATVYISLLADEARRSTGGRLEPRAREALDGDYLSPLVSYLLYPDLLQRIIPWRVASFDRARAIERTWERDLASAGFPVADGLLSLWEEHGNSLPALLLNATWVETGMPILISSLQTGTWNPSPMDHALAAIPIRYETCLRSGRYIQTHVDMFCPDLQTAPMRASSAVHLSARFPFVSPAARIDLTPSAHQVRSRVDRETHLRKEATSEVWGHVVDGGYFESSGANTAEQLLAFLQDKMIRYPQLRPVAVLINNAPGEGLSQPLQQRADPLVWAHDALAPPATLFATRDARGLIAQDAAQRRALDGQRGEESTYRLVLQPDPGDGYAPPLGWHLSRKAKERMHSAIADEIGGRICALITRHMPSANCR
jgi:hypothetical protein